MGQLPSTSYKRKKWKDFLAVSVVFEDTPAFSQYVTHKFFKLIIEEDFKVFASNSLHMCHLTPDDQSALRYVAGYVCRKVYNKVQNSYLADLILTLVSEVME